MKLKIFYLSALIAELLTGGMSQASTLKCANSEASAVYVFNQNDGGAQIVSYTSLSLNGEQIILNSPFVNTPVILGQFIFLGKPRRLSLSQDFPYLTKVFTQRAQVLLNSSTTPSFDNYVICTQVDYIGPHIP